MLSCHRAVSEHGPHSQATAVLFSRLSDTALTQTFFYWSSTFRKTNQACLARALSVRLLSQVSVLGTAPKILHPDKKPRDAKPPPQSAANNSMRAISSAGLIGHTVSRSCWKYKYQKPGRPSMGRVQGKNASHSECEAP